jgi:hypothetical protein
MFDIIEVKKIAQKCIKIEKAKFSSIKEVRPNEGSHIFVWDAENKNAVPTKYSGTEDTWKYTKHLEKRFTHFIELDIPE